VAISSDPLKDLLAEFARMVYPLKRDNVSQVPGQKTPLLMFGYVSAPNVAGTICEAAWLAWQRKSIPPPTMDEFVAEVCETLERLRRGLRGEKATMPVKVGLAGLKLRGGARGRTRPGLGIGQV
jgi:hypothetical protein